MHILLREMRTLDEAEAAVDLGQSPAPLALLSFSDSDLGAVASAWERIEDVPEMRLARLASLRHPMSVDLYLADTLASARCVVVRLLGGLEYWRYGAEELSALARAEGIALALIPGDGRDDDRLREMSTVSAAHWARLDALLREGGPDNAGVAIRLMRHLAGLGADDAAAVRPLPAWGEHPMPGEEAADGALAVLVIYRSHLLSGDVAPAEALAAALRVRGLRVRAIFVDSLKSAATAASVVAMLQAWRPAVVLNITAFAARRDGAGSPLDAADAPVLQLVVAGASAEAWEASSRGLGQADLAAHVALPELDGRLLTGAVAFKAEAPVVPGLQFRRSVLAPAVDGIALTADRAAGWARLRAAAPAERRLAVVLSDYPGVGGQEGHAVGLDSFASLSAILGRLHEAGYRTGGSPEVAPLSDAPAPAEAALSAAALARALCRSEASTILSLDTYRRAFGSFPAPLRAAVLAAWGEPEEDPAVCGKAFHLRHLRLNHCLVAVQPDRGDPAQRKASYHDPDLPPRHGFLAFYLWLRQAEDVHAILHLGTHGSLEWLPGKAVALSQACAPAAITGGLPVIYPFIVNNPGEAAVAKRRLGAVTIGHLTPPLRPAGLDAEGQALERLIDEYAAADGLDRRRTALLRRDILERAERCGLLRESGVAADAPDEEALARLDAFLCDVKEMQIRDGLHIFGEAPAPERRALLIEALERSCPAVPPPALIAALDGSAPAEAAALLAALDGRMVAPGPAGAPSRGRADVLPTGRNLFALDPRTVPTRSALVLAERAAAELLRRHRQEQGDHLRSLVIDLWGSATLRTGGEELAMALLLMGVRPLWDEGSSRATGVEVVPLAVLDRPRVDVTLRISGLFRDAFPAQITLFDAAVTAVAARDEAADWNPLAGALAALDGDARRRAAVRIFGAAPGQYGTGLEDPLARGGWQDRTELAALYLAGSATGYGQDTEGVADPGGFQARVAAAEAFLHAQDHAETDVLESLDTAAHAGGFAAAAGVLGGQPALYHADISQPGVPRLRTTAEEVARVVRGRAANRRWIEGQMRHGYRGAAEIARSVEALHGFAATLPARFDPQFDLLYAATIEDGEVLDFLAQNNPAALAALRARFREALERGLWQPRRNAVAAELLS